jgi:hypothetical protein
MTPKEFVKSIYPQAKLIKWRPKAAYPMQMAISIGKSQDDVFGWYYGSDTRIPWENGRDYINKKMMEKLQS